MDCANSVLYNKTLNKHVTALFCLYLGNVDSSANHFRNAPVGGHTCLRRTCGLGITTVFFYRSLSPCLGGRAKNLRRGYQEDPQQLDILQVVELILLFSPSLLCSDYYHWLLWVLLRGPIHSFACSQPPQVHCVHPRLGKCAHLRGQCTHNYQLLYLIFVCLWAMGTVR